MPNIATVLKSEIARLARKEVKHEISKLKQDMLRLKSHVRKQRQQIASLESQNRHLKKATIRSGLNTAAEPGQNLTRLRFTGARVKRMRQKTGLSQADFGKLIGVTPITVCKWEGAGTAALTFRGDSKSRLASLQKVGSREAKERLEALADARTGERGKRRKKKTGTSNKRRDKKKVVRSKKKVGGSRNK